MRPASGNFFFPPAADRDTEVQRSFSFIVKKKLQKMPVQNGRPPPATSPTTPDELIISVSERYLIHSIAGVGKLFDSNFMTIDIMSSSSEGPD